MQHRNFSSFLGACFVFAVAAFCSTTPVSAQLPISELAAIWPSACKAGSQVELHIASGARNDEADRLLFSHSGISSKVITTDPLAFNKEREKKNGHFKVDVAPDVPPGRYEMRFVGRHGVSNPRSFIVHQLNSVQHTAGSHTRLAPKDLAADTWVHCKATASEVDYFQFEGAGGKTLRISVYATQIDSRMIPHVELFDQKGRLIQTRYGTDESDPTLVLPVHKTQKFTLAVSDAIYRGGNEYPYSVVVQNAETAPTFQQTASSSLIRMTHDYSNLFSDATEIEETSDAKNLNVPCRIVSHFDSRSDVDVYQFSAKQGDEWIIDVVSHRAGQPTDARLTVERAEPQQNGDPKWQQVANDDDSNNVSDGVLRLNTSDPIVRFKAPKTGTYRFTLRDLDNGTSLSDKQKYWIDVRKPTHGFDLIVYPHYPARDVKQVRRRGANLFRSGTFGLRVFAMRQDGWTGAIHLFVTGLPSGVTCQPAVLAANRDQVELVLVADEHAVSAQATIQVTGKAKVNGKEVTVTATPVTTRWGRGGQRDIHRLRKSDDLVIGVIDEDQSPISFKIGEANVAEVKKGAELKLPIKLTRRDGAKNDCVCRPRDLPPNMTAGEVKIAKDKNEGTLVLKTNPKAVPGTYSMWLRTETKIKHKPNPQALQRTQAYREVLQRLLDDPANKDKLKDIQAAIKVADARVEAAKGAAKDQDLTVFLPSHHFSIRITE